MQKFRVWWNSFKTVALLISFALNMLFLIVLLLLLMQIFQIKNGLVEPLVDDVYNITTEVEDLAGNISLLGGPLRITVDSTMPQRPTINLEDFDDTGSSDLDNVTIGDLTDDDPDAVVRGNGVMDFVVTAQAGATVVIKDGNTVIDTFTSAGTDVRTLTLAEGTHPLSAEVTDLAGNVSHQAEELVVTVDLPTPRSSQRSTAMPSRVKRSRSTASTRAPRPSAMRYNSTR